MSLVDYASSSDDENDTVPEKPRQQDQKPQSAPQPQPQPRPSTTPHNDESNQPPKLPDASMLLSSPSIPDHASVSRKRDSPSSSSLPRGKVPRGSLPRSKNIPETGSGLLVPPQLRGRSNIVTEDIGKLFVKKQPDPPSLQ